jgi:hypothetical protein
MEWLIPCIAAPRQYARPLGVPYVAPCPYLFPAQHEHHIPVAQRAPYRAGGLYSARFATFSEDTMRLTAILLAASIAACAKKQDTTSDSAAASVAASHDADVAAQGNGAPAGYAVVTDDSTAKVTSIRYLPSSGNLDVTTGPAHIVYAAKDTARGAYTVTATITQLEAPRHPEAYGVFVGGHDLDKPVRTYTYFVVRGTGEFLVKTRDGAKTNNVMSWSANSAVPKADSAGKATYRLAVRVAADSVRFLVNDKQVAAVKAGTVPTDGVAGLRINHNLHVLTSPVSISR